MSVMCAIAVAMRCTKPCNVAVVVLSRSNLNFEFKELAIESAGVSCQSYKYLYQFKTLSTVCYNRGVVSVLFLRARSISPNLNSDAIACLGRSNLI
jgi:hypothetical protein